MKIKENHKKQKRKAKRQGRRRTILHARRASAVADLCWFVLFCGDIIIVTNLVFFANQPNSIVLRSVPCLTHDMQEPSQAAPASIKFSFICSFMILVRFFSLSEPAFLCVFVCLFLSLFVYLSFCWFGRHFLLVLFALYRFCEWWLANFFSAGWVKLFIHRVSSQAFPLDLVRQMVFHPTTINIQNQKVPQIIIINNPWRAKL